MLRGDKIAKAEGKLGVLLPGMGAVTTTFIAGVESIRKGLHKPFGSLTQLGTIRLGKRTDKSAPFIKDFVSSIHPMKAVFDQKYVKNLEPELYPEHDLFIQQAKLKNTLRYMMEEEQVTHLGIEYYEK